MACRSNYDAVQNNYNLDRRIQQKDLNDEYDSIYFELKNIAWKLYDLTCDFKQLQIGTEIVEWNDLFSNSSINQEKLSPQSRHQFESRSGLGIDRHFPQETVNANCRSEFVKPDEGVSSDNGVSPRFVSRPPHSYVNVSTNWLNENPNQEYFAAPDQYSPRFEIERLLAECQLPPQYVNNIKRGDDRGEKHRDNSGKPYPNIDRDRQYPNTRDGQYPNDKSDRQYLNAEDNFKLPMPSSKHPQYRLIISEKNTENKPNNIYSKKMSNIEFHDDTFKRYDSIEELAYKLDLPRLSHQTIPKSFSYNRETTDKCAFSENRNADIRDPVIERAAFPEHRTTNSREAVVKRAIFPEHRITETRDPAFKRDTLPENHVTDNREPAVNRATFPENRYTNTRSRTNDRNMYDRLRRELESDVKLRKFLPRFEKLEEKRDENDDNVFVIDTQNFKILAFPRTALSDLEEY